jgi:hypothetical protein
MFSLSAEASEGDEMHRMIIKTQTVRNGRPVSTTEHVRHIPADQLEARREAARRGAPAGATRTIKVLDET